MTHDEPGRRGGSVFVWIAGAVLLVAVVVALVVVVRNAGRVKPPEPPVVIGQVEADTALVRFPRTMRARLGRLEGRFARYRDTVPGLTPAQDSLADECAAGFAAVRAELAVLDTLRGARARAEAARAIRERYNELRSQVNRFTRAALDAVPEPDLDSLDVELRRLLEG